MEVIISGRAVKLLIGKILYRAQNLSLQNVGEFYVKVSGKRREKDLDRVSV